ncbi:MAG: S8 family serine peptidase, partial [Desulfurococcales archaeon]|nr:S8 family serine peptidase [Desulfurococcales archaeon]
SYAFPSTSPNNYAKLAGDYGKYGADMWKSKVSPELLKEDTYKSVPTLPIPGAKDVGLDSLKSSLQGEKLFRISDGKARIAILYTGGEQAVEKIKDIATVVSGASFNGKSGILFAWADMDEVQQIADLPFVSYVMLDKQYEPTMPKALEIEKSEGTGGGFGSLIYGARDILGATYAWDLGYTGEGVNVAIVDTGVDLGSSDLGVEAIARDAAGMPLLFDADEVGLVLTVNPAIPVANDTVEVFPFAGGAYGDYVLYYDGYDGGLYLTDYGIVFMYDFYSGSYDYYMYPAVYQNFTVPDTVNMSAPIGFGLVSQNIYTGGFFLWYLAPAILTDSINDNDTLYDTAYIDLSTTYYFVANLLAEFGYIDPGSINASWADFSFIDEAPVSYGNEVVARDFTGDGVNDFSLGALSAAFNDAFGVLTGMNWSFDWRDDWESIGYILPGMDTEYGWWFDLVFDFHSHGTFCAHVVAGRGNVPRPLGYGDGIYNLSGIAPHAKIGGAPALWNGNVVIAQLFLAGFDLVDPSSFAWVYTGSHQADVISNSWGSSYLLINGYGSDADVTALFENVISLLSGTIIVQAAGNGGPGFGSVTMPGTSTAVITVAATTEFFYRPVYGYLPGAYGQVISWSDRGPTQFGYTKPDVSNIGSFAWSVGRPIDGYGDGLYAFDLFGGTSEATPMTAGSIAIIIQALRDNGYSVDPMTVKTLVKSTATPMGYDAFSQGSGHVNITNAINTILDGGFTVYSHDSITNIIQFYDITMAALLGAPLDQIHAIWDGYADTSLYFGVVPPGTSKTLTAHIGTYGNVSGTPEVDFVHLVRTKGYLPLEYVDLNASRIYIPGQGYVPVSEPYAVVDRGKLYLNLSALPSGSRLLLVLEQSIFTGDLDEITVSYPLWVMDPYGRNGSYTPFYVMGAELSYWIDYDFNNTVSVQETARIQYDIREGNVMHVQIGNPQAEFELTKETALSYLSEYMNMTPTNATMAPVLDLRIFSNAWYGTDVGLVPFNIYMKNYEFREWSWFNVVNQSSDSFTVEANVPLATGPGIYEGYAIVTIDGQTIFVPISVAVPTVLSPDMPSKAIYPAYQSLFYNNYAFKGALDQGWRPETGDWRVYPVVIYNSAGSIGGLQVSVTWSDPTSSFDVGVIGPGMNYWGVSDPSYATWIDGAVTAAKLSGVSSFVGAYGVYTYFDFPSPTKAEVISPVAAPQLDNYAGDAVVYWVVVHQIFSATPSDSVIVNLRALKQFTPTTLSLPAGGMTSQNIVFYSGDMYDGYINTSNIMVLPLGNATGSISVNVAPTTLWPFSMKFFTATIMASGDANGTFLVIIPVDGVWPSVIWGSNVYGDSYLLYYQPSQFYVYLYVTVG